MPSSLRPPRRSLLILSFGAALALAACHEGAASASHGEGGPTPVTVVTLKAAPVTVTRELPGRTSASLVAEVRPQVNGIVERRLFTEGGVVKEGQPLYQLDDATYRADYATAKASLERAQVTLSMAESDAKRADELSVQALVSAQDHEKAQAAFRQATAEVKAAEASAQRAKLMVDYARITSPISGRIGKSSVTQGALVTANQPQALTLVQQLDPMFVDVTQSSAELLELRKQITSGKLESAGSMPVTILLEDGTEYEQEGKLAFSDVTVDPSTGTFTLRVVVPNKDERLLPGMYVRARLGAGVRQNGLLVPQQGITRDPKGNATAMVVGKDNKVASRVVKVSRTLDDQWLVDEGLTEGDRVIVEGLQKIGPGSPVNATEAAPGASKSADAE